PGGGPQPQVVQAEAAGWGDLERGLDLPVVDGLELRHRDPGLVEEHLPGVAEPGAGEVDLDLVAALTAQRAECAEVRAGGVRGRGADGQDEERGEGGFHRVRTMSWHEGRDSRGTACAGPQQEGSVGASPSLRIERRVWASRQTLIRLAGRGSGEQFVADLAA